MTPSDDGPIRWRGSLLLLGVAGIVVATVFAVVASLAVRPAAQVRPFPDMPGPVIADGSTTSTGQTTVTTEPTPTTTETTPTTTPVAPPPANQLPVSVIAPPVCNGLTCSVNGRGSSDRDGRVTLYVWGFGDGDGAQGSNLRATSHTYDRPGRYRITLLVMDDDRATRTASVSVSVRR